MDDCPLTRQRSVSRILEVMQGIHIDCEKYSRHSFQVGAATTAACQGVQDSLDKTMGCWESIAYQMYVRTPQEQLVAVPGD